MKMVIRDIIAKIPQITTHNNVFLSVLCLHRATFDDEFVHKCKSVDTTFLYNTTSCPCLHAIFSTLPMFIERKSCDLSPDILATVYFATIISMLKMTTVINMNSYRLTHV